ncbi:ABC transporter substrate-binding protein [Goodfellowiella coeruleoviolacea]|uniref:ABC transporter substrate-binding protein n=1 Tax=Goodfellowiella coeruleoviolacea TaxID=334858 RepID=UPI0020A407DD|nr:sugar ABC transporter substrate-binding protein [Goodfellowiella coeruleoviolacea]
MAGLGLSLGLAGCGSGGGADQTTTLTYWASNQAASQEQDKQILQPELDKFRQRTGITVEVEVIPWSDLLNRILAATSSGEGPDVVNIGNTWSASLQATGAFTAFDDATLAKVGGRDRFLASSLASTGAVGQPPASVPVYGLSYGLFYNKKLFAEAGITAPPSTWDELVTVATALTKPDQQRWGLGILGSSYTENAHFAYLLGRQHGAELFDGDTPRFDSPQMVAAVRQYVDLLATHEVVNPSNAEYLNDVQILSDFAAGKTAMVMIQNNAVANLRTIGMPEADYGVVPIPMTDPLPAGGKRVNSHVAGVNLGVFANSDNPGGAMTFVEFLTSPEEQKILNHAFGTLPVVPDAYTDPAFQTPTIETFRSVLADTAEPLPMIPQEAQFETLIGAALKDLLARAASGQPVDDATIHDKLATANEQMKSAG